MTVVVVVQHQVHLIKKQTTKKEMESSGKSSRKKNRGRERKEDPQNPNKQVIKTPDRTKSYAYNNVVKDHHTAPPDHRKHNTTPTPPAVIRPFTGSRVPERTKPSTEKFGWRRRQAKKMKEGFDVFPEYARSTKEASIEMGCRKKRKKGRKDKRNGGKHWDLVG